MGYYRRRRDRPYGPALDRPVTLTRRDPGMRNMQGRFELGTAHTRRAFGRLAVIDERYNPLPSGGRTAGIIRLVVRYDQAWIDAAGENESASLDGWQVVLDGITYTPYAVEELPNPRRRFMVISASRSD